MDVFSYEELTQKLVLWIREKVTAAGSKGVVFGMSGGVDSSLVAVLSKHAFLENSLGIIMPCHSIISDKHHAELVANQFNISTEVVVLDKVFDVLISSFPKKYIDNTNAKLATANIKARLRMITLYYYANCMDYLVIGSGNKSELSIGYFTKYGDSGVDLLPLGDMVKYEVRELSRYLGIPQIIIDKAPSAGLWEGQTDEAEMGFTYKDLDDYLLSGKLEEVDIKYKIDDMMKKSWHKRHLSLKFPG